MADAKTYYLVGIIVGVVLAVVNGLVGAMFIRSGDRKRGSKYFILGGAMLMLTIALMLSMNDG